MFTLPPTQIRERTRTPGGDKWTEFCDAVIRAHCAFHGVPDSAFRGTLRTNLPDGGIDTEVIQAVVGDTSGYMNAPTIWQYKAMDAKDAFKTMKAEVNKPEAKNRIQNDYAYRLCVCDQITPADIAKQEAILTEYVRAINPTAPVANILGLDKLSQWAEQYLGLVIRFGPGVGLHALHIDAWGRNARAITRLYQPVPDWELARKSLEEHIEFSRLAPDPVLSLQGESGVGKTRLVYEIVAAKPGLRNMVVYTDSQEHAVDLARAVANADYPAVRAVIIADECSMETRVRLNQTLQGCRDRVRVIAIDNTGDRVTSPSPDMWLERMPLGVLDALLTANYPHVPYERRRAYVQLSGGFAGLAADMCKWDAQIATVGNVQPALGTVRDYLHTRVPREEDRITLMALSLVTKIGHASDLEEQLDVLCEWVGSEITKDVLKRSARRLHDNPGYVAQGVAFFYVRPELIAQIAFEDAWQRWAANDPEGFLKRVPPILTGTFEKRVVRSASSGVRGCVAEFFRGFVASLRPADLADLSTVDRLTRLIDTEPEQYLPTLRRLIGEATEEELRAVDDKDDMSGRWGPRRELVWLAERLAALSEFFDAAEEILLRLAVCETEPTISNNATGVWRRFFQIGLSGTAIPFPHRLSLLERRLADTDERIVELAVGGLERALKDRVSGSVGPAVVAGRIPPPEWMPETMFEVAQHFDAAVDVLVRACASGNPPLREHAFALLMEDMLLLLQRGDLEKVRRMVADYEMAVGGLPDTVRLKICEQVRMYLQRDGRDVRMGRRSDETNNDADSIYVERVAQWLAKMTPRDFHGRLVTAVGIPHWQRLEDDEKREWEQELQSLAEEIVATPDLLTSEGGWLCGAEALSAPILGDLIGRLDAQNLALLDDIVGQALQYRVAGLARGYVSGVLQTEPNVAERLNVTINAAEKQDPVIAFELFTAGGRRTRAFERTLKLVDAGALVPEYLRAFAWARDAEALTGAEFAKALTRLVTASETGNAAAGEAATELLWTRSEDARRADAVRRAGLESGAGDGAFPEEQDAVFPFGAGDLAWRVVESIADQIDGMTQYKWSQIVRALAPSDPVRAAHVAALALAEDRHDMEAQQVLVDLAEAHPREVMEELGNLLLREDEVGISLYMGNNKGLFRSIPDEVLIEWIDRHGLSAARRIARQLPPPYVGSNHEPLVPPVTEHVLRAYGDDKRVFDSFCMGVHSFQVYSGDIADEHEEEAREAKLFLNHSLAKVREWAEREIRSQYQDAAWWRRHMEEQNIE